VKLRASLPPALLFAVALIVPPIAGAHLEISPTRADPGRTQAIAFHIENESSSARTVRLDVALPPGVGHVKPLALGGWKFQQSGSPGSVRQISFVAGAPIGPGEAAKAFRVSMSLPRTPGATVSFKGVQAYDDGKRVRWIGPPGSDEPAPTLRLSTRAIPGATGALGATGRNSPAPAAENDDNDDGGISTTLIVVLAAAGVVALAVAGWFLNARRRRST
jgi:uncharacterized protein YcnI